MTFSHLLPHAVLFAFGCVSVFGAAGDTTNAISLATKPPHGDRVDRAWKRYRNQYLGYCVSYPSHWLRGDAFDGSGLLIEIGRRRYSKPTGEIDVGPMNLPTSEDARIKPASDVSDSLDQDLQEHLESLRKFARAEKMEIIEQRPLKVQGLPALYLKNKYYDPLERSTWMEEVVFIKRRGELYRVELQCPPDQIARFEPVFTYLVTTLEFDCTK